MYKKCIVCSNNTCEDLLFVSSNLLITLCKNCFHLQQCNNNDNNFDTSNSHKKNLHFNELLYRSFILKCVDKHKSKAKLKILNINDNDTQLLDILKGDILNITSLPKSSVSTVSLSSNFNPSYFSRHKCYRDVLSKSSIQYIKDEYDTFDLIILNTSLVNNANPNELLKLCQQICNSNTSLFLINYHSLNPIYYMTVDNSIKNFFSTNSLKNLCINNKFKLNDVEYDIDNNCNFYEISSLIDNQGHDSKAIISALYNDITCNTYDIDTYTLIRDLWVNTIMETGKLLDKYKNFGYELIIITSCVCCNIDNFFQNNDQIDYHIKCLTKSKLNDVLENENKKKYVFIILDSIEYNTVSDNLTKYLNELQFNKSNGLIYDIFNAIVHPI